MSSPSPVCHSCGNICIDLYYKCYCCPSFILCSSCLEHLEEQQNVLFLEDPLEHLPNQKELLHDPSHHFLRIKGTESLVSKVKSPLLSDRTEWRHEEICENCKGDIIGYRYFCPQCSVSLCESCEFKGNCLFGRGHIASHPLLKMVPPPYPSSIALSQGNYPSSSDKYGGTLLSETPSLSQYGVTVEVLKNMLRRENELRLGDEVQAKYKAGGYGAYVEITEDVQKQVAKEFDLEEYLGMELLQCAESLVSDSSDLAEIREISFYRKFNRMRDCPLEVGDDAPYVSKPLFRIDGSDFRFFEDFIMKPSLRIDPIGQRLQLPRACVVFAASHS